MWFSNWSNTIQAVQSQKQAGSLKRFKKKRKCTIRESKTKALISFAVTAKLSASLFSHTQIVGFPIGLLIFILSK